MTFEWQTAIAAILVVSAAAYLVRRGWRTIAGRRIGCGTCASCPADQNPSGKPLVTLDALTKPNDAIGRALD
jgi:hypothetical protein